MTPELWQRLKPLYSAALDLPEQGRTGYVEQMCHGDPELARELQALLNADQSAAHTLDPPLHDIARLFPTRPALLAPGSILSERFRIVRHLGSGGMGDVYEAQDLQLEPGRIAVKTLRPAIANNAGALARFKAEVLLARRVTGANVCRIYDLHLQHARRQTDPSIGAHAPADIAFLTMELLEGETLFDRIATRSPLPVNEICNIMQQLCCALLCIHEAGIIHRDLKSRNVMLVPHNGAENGPERATERVVVMDFGLARALSRHPEDSAIGPTQESLVAGTPSYMAPEQFEGSDVSQPTDMYALGLILYELITCTQPFAAGSPLAAAVRRGKLPPPPSKYRPEIPPAWDEIVARCLQFDPEARYSSAQEVLDALCHPRSLVVHLGKRRRMVIRKRSLGVVSAALVLFSLTLALWLGLHSSSGRTISPEAAKWYTDGMTALREGSYLKATRLLTEATHRDPTFALAHAALADAWAELDYTGPAQQEMLLASGPKEQQGLSELDRHYVNAVRATLTRDYSAAAQDYEAILYKLPNGSKAQGYVDLGRIYEKAGKVPETVASYEKAARLNPDAPAPFLHLGILKSRLRDPEGSAKAFSKAEALYTAESDPGGLAEVIYQRGYAANEVGDFTHAKQFVEQSLSLARQMPSIQLEVRSLSQLSSVAYNESRDDEAIRYANQAMQIAQENGLEYWSTDGLMRLGNAYLDKEDFAAAEAPLQQALHEAQQNGHPRLEANTELTLASLRDQQKRWDDSIRLATAALKYYQDYGFLNSADKAEMLILRGERDKGDYASALQAGTQLLKIADQTHSVSSVAMAQEFVGYVYLRMERYPEALLLFQSSVRNLQTLGQDPGYEQALCAETLWRLGRYGEAESALASIPPNMRGRNDLGTAIAATRARMMVSQGEYNQALSLIRSARAALPNARTPLNELDPIEISAQIDSGALADASVRLQEASGSATAHGRTDIEMRDHMLQAKLDLRLGRYVNARKNAEAAQAYFAQKNIAESTALSLLLEAQAAHGLQDSEKCVVLSRKSVDIFRQTQQSWGVTAFRTYLARPDRQRTMHTLAQLLGQTGDVPDELTR